MSTSQPDPGNFSWLHNFGDDYKQDSIESVDWYWPMTCILKTTGLYVKVQCFYMTMPFKKVVSVVLSQFWVPERQSHRGLLVKAMESTDWWGLCIEFHVLVEEALKYLLSCLNSMSLGIIIPFSSLVSVCFVCGWFVWDPSCSLLYLNIFFGEWEFGSFLPFLKTPPENIQHSLVWAVTEKILPWYRFAYCTERFFTILCFSLEDED